MNTKVSVVVRGTACPNCLYHKHLPTVERELVMSVSLVPVIDDLDADSPMTSVLAEALCPVCGWGKVIVMSPIQFTSRVVGKDLVASSERT